VKYPQTLPEAQMALVATLALQITACICKFLSKLKLVSDYFSRSV
jgi:hypothetical protein